MTDLKLAAGMSRLGTESAFVVLARAGQLAAEGRDIINLGIGQPDFPSPEHVVEERHVPVATRLHQLQRVANGLVEVEVVGRERRYRLDRDMLLAVPRSWLGVFE